MKVSHRENKSGEAGGDRGRQRERSETSRWNPFAKSLVHFQGTVCDRGGVRDYFVTKSSALVMFERGRAFQSQTKFQRVGQFERPTSGGFVFFYILLSFN